MSHRLVRLLLAALLAATATGCAAVDAAKLLGACAARSMGCQ